jgi:hypothetical protein
MRNLLKTTDFCWRSLRHLPTASANATLIKLDFSATAPKENVVSIILKVMHEAAMAEELGVKPSDVIYLDVSRQRQFTGKKLNKQLKRDIDAACETIEDIWPRVKQS